MRSPAGDSGRARRLAVELAVAHRQAGGQHALRHLTQGRFQQRGENLGHRPPDVRLDGEAVYFAELIIDAHKA